ncbi:MAG TPA: DHHA1 domain-containing protein, partial [Candidatus Babeliales bacterium]|nr:DHHA1 domain-containing protein [Candidatus Babeliales bacterium]
MITVDNGITAFAPALKAKELGIDLIITDHHRSHDHLPAAYAIVDPNQHGCPYPYKYLAGVGVSFKLMGLLYERLGLTLPIKIYELLLLGTVADVVPLVGENRYWVRQGLTYVNQTESLPLKILKQNGKFTKQLLSSTDIGFLLTPQINALGRLEDARDGVQFLIGANAPVVQQVGQVLLQLNQARKEIEKKILDDVVRKIEAGAIDLTTENVIMAASNDWAPGVIGLVASRLVGKYGKPTLLFHLTKDGLAKGSCRSIAAFSIFEALAQCSELIQQFGGHHQAAGLALKVENLPALKTKLEQIVAAQLTPADLRQTLALDAELALPDLNPNFMRALSLLEPFGHQNSCPSFYLKNVVLVQQPILMKELHVKCQVFAEGM